MQFNHFHGFWDDSFHLSTPTSMHHGRPDAQNIFINTKPYFEGKNVLYSTVCTTKKIIHIHHLELFGLQNKFGIKKNKTKQKKTIGVRPYIWANE